MIITEQKDFSEILGSLEKHQRLFLVGCGICATSWSTGGEKEVKEMIERLTQEGKTCTGWVVTKEATCDARCTRRDLRHHAAEIEEADAVLVLACGAGVQTVAPLVDIPTYPGLNSLGLARLQRLTLADQRCVLCGDCVLATTGGICPVTLCPKGLMNGPCGGYQDGKCEVDRERDCAWVTIYQQLEQFGQGDKLKVIRPAKDYSKMSHPHLFDKRTVKAT
ncbi:MAG: methylenetetrahydrofolate reductase C-terminal domain-containing protein [Anaerolineae bacterium]